MWDDRKYSLVVCGRPTLTLRARVGRPRTTSSYLRSSHILGWFSFNTNDMFILNSLSSRYSYVTSRHPRIVVTYLTGYYS